VCFRDRSSPINFWIYTYDRTYASGFKASTPKTDPIHTYIFLMVPKVNVVFWPKISKISSAMQCSAVQYTAANEALPRRFFCCVMGGVRELFFWESSVGSPHCCK